MNYIKFIIFINLFGCSLCGAQELEMRNKISLTIEQAEQMVRENNLQLRSKVLEIEAAKADLKQSKLFENPQVSVLHNVYNRITGKYFDMGYDAETDVEVEQPIAIGGQRSQKINKAKALVSSAEFERDDTEREIFGDLESLFFSLYYVQKKQEVYDKELASVDKIVKAMEEQTAKGNMPRMELQRIQTMRFQLLQEKNELLCEEQEMQHQLQIMLGDSENYYQPQIKNSSIFNDTYTINSLDLTSQLESRPDLVALGYEMKAGEHEVKLQKAQALPQVSLKGEYDKNGSICHNFWGIGFSLSVPIFNQNQGNIAQAKAQYDQAKLNRELKQRQAENEVKRLVAEIKVNQQLVEEANQHLSASTESLLAEAQQQFMKHNISLLEFLDLYSSYKETHLAVLDAHNKMLQSAVKLNTEVGRQVIRY